MPGAARAGRHRIADDRRCRWTRRSPAWCSASGEPRIFDRDELLRYPETRRLVEFGALSACSVPLHTPQGPIGTLDLASFDRDAFSPALFGLLTRIAGQIAIAVRNAISYERIESLNAQLAREKVYLQDEIRSDQLFEDIVGGSAALRRVLKEIETVAPTGSTVLITGETGSGKELVARAIHQLSERRDGAFVKLNCAAIPTGLLESELFGHERGAFTGAIAQRIGRFELANQGTVFLDEIGEIPLELQPKLLRVLQEREFERLGGTRTLRSDARLIAATNRDLGQLVDQQKFRSDLFYRLNVFPVHVPPLRDRREDIPMLVRHFAQQFARRMKRTIETIPVETMQALSRYDWPGNIRELQNLIERAVILSPGPTLFVPIEALTSRPAGSRRRRRRRRRDRRNARRDRSPSHPRRAAGQRLGAGRARRRRRPPRHQALDAAVPHAQARDRAPRPPDHTDRSAAPASGAAARPNASPLAPASMLAANPLAPRPARPRQFHHNSHRHHGLAPRRARGAAPARSSLLVSRPCSGSPSTPTRIDWC